MNVVKSIIVEECGKVFSNNYSEKLDLFTSLRRSFELLYNTGALDLLKERKNK